MRACLLAMLLLPAAAAADTGGKVGKGEPPAPTVGECLFDLRNGNRDAKVAALQRLNQLGPQARDAVPDLVAALSQPDEGIRHLAVTALGAVGPEAKAAVPMLRLLLRKENEYSASHVAASIFQITKKLDKDVVRAALVSSGRYKKVDPLNGILRDHLKEALPFMIEMLDDTEKEARRRAIESLAALGGRVNGRQPVLETLGDAAKPIGPALVKRLDDFEHEVALAAAHALVQVEPKLAAKAIPRVVEELKAARVNYYTARDVLRPAAAEAVPLLVALLGDPKLKGRDQVINTLAGLDESRAHLEKALKHENVSVRVGGAQALGLKFADAAGSAPALVEALRDPERPVRLAAAQALVWIGTPRQTEGIPVLVECIKEGDAETQQSAADFLRRIGPPAKAAAGALRDLLKDARPSVRFEAAVALATIEPSRAQPAVPALIEGLGQDEHTWTVRAEAALARIGPPARAALPALVPLLEHKDVYTVLNAAEAVARIDPSRAPRACRVLGDLILEPKNHHSMTRSYAIQALRRIGPDARPALPALLFILQEPEDAPFHADAAVAALSIDPERSTMAVAYGRRLLTDKDFTENQYELVEALPGLGPKAKAFLPELKQILTQCKTPHLVEHAARTVAAIGPDARDVRLAVEERLKSERSVRLRKLLATALKPPTPEDS